MESMPVIAVIAGTLFLFGFLYLSFSVIRRKMVIRSSRAIFELDKLNSSTRSQFSGEYNHTIQVVSKCRSKAQYDSRTLHQCLSQYLAEHFSAYKSIYEAVLRDQELYKQYSEQFRSIELLRGTGWDKSLNIPRDEYIRIEEALLGYRKLKAPQFRIDVRKIYTSPKKRNHYQDQGYFYSSTFIFLCERLFRYEKRRQNISKERKLMTSTLRYMILERDGFRCQACGRSQEDGVVLQIDHIKPVSKGGKTEPSNLRVLCSECNLGKGDRYTPSVAE